MAFSIFGTLVPLPILLANIAMHFSTFLSSLTTLSTLTAQSYAVSTSLQQILNNQYKEPLYTYPTSLTQDIIPVAIHSHNDYWRPIPFYSALSVGAISIEADVWLYNGTLYVGHEPSALTTQRTLRTLYIDPILAVLHRQNPRSNFVTTGATHNGVYDVDSKQTLYLFVDMKTDGTKTWPYLVDALQPL